MKKIFKLNSNFLMKLKNFWFAAQLLIVSVSLPVMSIVQMSRPETKVKKQQQEEVIKKAVNQNEVIGLQKAGNLISIS